MLGRRSFSLFAVLLALSPLGGLLGGCGSVTIAGHHVNLFRASLCAYSGFRAHHDLKSGHKLAAAFQAYLALHNCRRVVSH
jgi:hypothetical protein